MVVGVDSGGNDDAGLTSSIFAASNLIENDEPVFGPPCSEVIQGDEIPKRGDAEPPFFNGSFVKMKPKNVEDH